MMDVNTISYSNITFQRQELTLPPCSDSSTIQTEDGQNCIDTGGVSVDSRPLLSRSVNGLSQPVLETISRDEQIYGPGNEKYEGFMVAGIKVKYIELPFVRYVNPDASLVMPFDNKWEVIQPSGADAISEVSIEAINQKMVLKEKVDIPLFDQKAALFVQAGKHRVIANYDLSSIRDSTFKSLVIDILEKIKGSGKKISTLAFAVVNNQIMGGDVVERMRAIFDQIYQKTGDGQIKTIVFCVDGSGFKEKFDQLKTQLQSTLLDVTESALESPASPDPDVSQFISSGERIKTGIASGGSVGVSSGNLFAVSSEGEFTPEYPRSGASGVSSTNNDNRAASGVSGSELYSKDNQEVVCSIDQHKPIPQLQVPLALLPGKKTIPTDVSLAPTTHSSEDNSAFNSAFKKVQEAQRNQQLQQIRKPGLAIDNTVSANPGLLVYEIVTGQTEYCSSDQLIHKLKKYWEQYSRDLQNRYPENFTAMKIYMDNHCWIKVAGNEPRFSDVLLQLCANAWNIRFEYYKPNFPVQYIEPDMAGGSPETVSLMNDGQGCWFGLVEQNNKPHQKSLLSEAVPGELTVAGPPCFAYQPPVVCSKTVRQRLPGFEKEQFGYSDSVLIAKPLSIGDIVSVKAREPDATLVSNRGGGAGYQENNKAESLSSDQKKPNKAKKHNKRKNKKKAKSPSGNSAQTKCDGPRRGETFIVQPTIVERNKEILSIVAEIKDLHQRIRDNNRRVVNKRFAQALIENAFIVDFTKLTCIIKKLFSQYDNDMNNDDKRLTLQELGCLIDVYQYAYNKLNHNHDLRVPNNIQVYFENLQLFWEICERHFSIFYLDEQNDSLKNFVGLFTRLLNCNREERSFAENALVGEKKQNWYIVTIESLVSALWLSGNPDILVTDFPEDTLDILWRVKEHLISSEKTVENKNKSGGAGKPISDALVNSNQLSFSELFNLLSALIHAFPKYPTQELMVNSYGVEHPLVRNASDRKFVEWCVLVCKERVSLEPIIESLIDLIERQFFFIPESKDNILNNDKIVKISQVLELLQNENKTKKIFLPDTFDEIVNKYRDRQQILVDCKNAETKYCILEERVSVLEKISEEEENARQMRLKVYGSRSANRLIRTDEESESSEEEMLLESMDELRGESSRSCYLVHQGDDKKHIKEVVFEEERLYAEAIRYLNRGKKEASLKKYKYLISKYPKIIYQLEYIDIQWMQFLDNQEFKSISSHFCGLSDLLSDYTVTRESVEKSLKQLKAGVATGQVRNLNCNLKRPRDGSDECLKINIQWLINNTKKITGLIAEANRLVVDFLGIMNEAYGNNKKQGTVSEKCLRPVFSDEVNERLYLMENNFQRLNNSIKYLQSYHGEAKRTLVTRQSWLNLLRQYRAEENQKKKNTSAQGGSATTFLKNLTGSTSSSGSGAKVYSEPGTAKKQRPKNAMAKTQTDWIREVEESSIKLTKCYHPIEVQLQQILQEGYSKD